MICARTFFPGFVMLLCVTTYAAPRPTIKVKFVLDSPTLRMALTYDRQDHTKEVGARVVAEFAKEACRHFPFIDWSIDVPRKPDDECQPNPDARPPVKEFSVRIFEQPIKDGPSDYYIQYLDGRTQISIGRTEPFIPHDDHHQPTNNEPILTKRAADWIVQDLKQASKSDFFDFYLKDIEVVRQPPPKPNLRVHDACVVDLPLRWDALRPDEDKSKLKVKFKSTKPGHRLLSSGILKLDGLHPCDEDCDGQTVVQGHIYYWEFPEVDACNPSNWPPEAEQVLAAAQTVDIFVNEYQVTRSSVPSVTITSSPTP